MDALVDRLSNISFGPITSPLGIVIALLALYLLFRAGKAIIKIVLFLVLLGALYLTFYAG